MKQRIEVTNGEVRIAGLIIKSTQLGNCLTIEVDPDAPPVVSVEYDSTITYSVRSGRLEHSDTVGETWRNAHQKFRRDIAEALGMLPNMYSTAHLLSEIKQLRLSAEETAKQYNTLKVDLADALVNHRSVYTAAVVARVENIAQRHGII